MVLIPGERTELIDAVFKDMMADRGCTIDMNDALTYAERQVIGALLSGQRRITLDLDSVVPMERAQPEAKALFKEHSQNIFWDKCLDVIDNQMFPDIK